MVSKHHTLRHRPCQLTEFMILPMPKYVYSIHSEKEKKVPKSSNTTSPSKLQTKPPVPINPSLSSDQQAIPPTPKKPNLNQYSSKPSQSAFPTCTSTLERSQPFPQHFSQKVVSKK